MMGESGLAKVSFEERGSMASMMKGMRGAGMGILGRSE
jgi:hypothetical protein